MTSDLYASKFWLKSYDKNVKPHPDYPKNKTYADMFLDSVKLAPDKVAIKYLNVQFTYKQLDDLSNKFANFLVTKGLKPGDVVSVCSLNVPAYYIAMHAIAKAGCILNGMSALLTPREFEYQLNDVGAKMLIIFDLLWGNAAQIIGKTKVADVVITAVTDLLPNESPVNLPKADGIAVHHFAQIIKETQANPVKVKISDEATFLIQYTGGTTGPSKGAVILHKNIVRHILQLVNFLDLKTGEDRFLSPFPLFHVAGMLMCVIPISLAATQVAIQNPRDLDGLIKIWKEYNPTCAGLVPTLTLELMKKPEFKQLDFSGVQWIMSGAAPFPAEYLPELEKIIGEGKFIEGLGMTEATIISTNPRHGKHKAGSVGLPLCDTEVKVVDPVTKKTVPVGEVGELAIKGPQVMKEYYNKPEETAHALRNEWFYGGDVVKMDEDGYIFVVDRVKDMVNVSGYKVFTRELDDVICTHPDVYLAASVGLPNPDRPAAEIVATAIVLKPGVEKTDTEKEKIRSFIREREAPYKVPKIIVFMDQLPISAVGKVLKRELRDMLKTQV